MSLAICIGNEDQACSICIRICDGPEQCIVPVGGDQQSNDSAGLTHHV